MNENNMIEIGNAHYQAAYRFFSEKNYEASVESFIKAYECGIKREEILENIYACFIMPNEKEFQQNYEENRQELLNIPYENLEIDFIPVSDSKFYLFHNSSREFIGSFQLDNAPINADNDDFESVLIADCWDFRQMYPVIKDKTWEVVYILLNEQKNCFASFFKLPHFRELYMENVIIFENVHLLKLFFEEYSEFYLPKKILAASDKYDDILTGIHKKRIRDLSGERKNIFLSILIPSYNRGSKALSAVQEICHSKYDSEIEIIVSDNGSTAYAKEYQAIRDMKDARVRYQRNEYNMGFCENFVRALDMAQGKYAIFSSDEDIMLICNLPQYLNYFKKYGACGVFSTSGKGDNFITFDEETLQLHGREALVSGINRNYITGIGYNMSLVRRLNLIEYIRKHADNVMVDFYPHCVLNFKLSLISDMLVCGQPQLWQARESEEVDGEDTENIKSYMSIDSREKQYMDLMELYIEAGIIGEELCWLFLKCCQKFCWLLWLSYCYYSAYYEKQGLTWGYILKDAISRCNKNLILFKDYMTEEAQMNIRNDLELLYRKALKNEFM